MKYSFIVTTLNRPRELGNCIDSLLSQTEKSFEIIIIDQSDNSLSEQMVLEKEKSASCITYKKVMYKALSRARNEALKLVKGDYFALVDDDAVYSPDYLEKCSMILQEKCIVSGIIKNNSMTEREFMDYSIADEGEILSLEKVRRMCPSAGLIFPRTIIKDCGLFDENLGIGAYFGAAEETDMLLRALQNKYFVIHTKQVVLWHPVSTQTSYEKVRSYARGGGALVKKHLFFYHNFKLFFGGLKLLFYPIIKMILFFYNREKRSYEINRLIGFYEGFTKYNRELMNKAGV